MIGAGDLGFLEVVDIRVFPLSLLEISLKSFFISGFSNS